MAIGAKRAKSSKVLTLVHLKRGPNMRSGKPTTITMVICMRQTTQLGELIFEVD